MLDVRLIISDNTKASKLLDLLKELPFVEITSCQEVDPQDLILLAFIVRRYQSQPGKSGRVINEVSSRVNLNVSSAIYDSVMESYGKERLLPIFRQMTDDPKPADTIEFQVDDNKMCCRYLNGFRVIYRLGTMAWTGQASISILHIVQVS